MLGSWLYRLVKHAALYCVALSCCSASVASPQVTSKEIRAQIGVLTSSEKVDFQILTKSVDLLLDTAEDRDGYFENGMGSNKSLPYVSSRDLVSLLDSLATYADASARRGNEREEKLAFSLMLTIMLKIAALNVPTTLRNYGETSSPGTLRSDMQYAPLDVGCSSMHRALEKIRANGDSPQKHKRFGDLIRQIHIVQRQMHPSWRQEVALLDSLPSSVWATSPTNLTFSEKKILGNATDIHRRAMIEIRKSLVRLNTYLALVTAI